MEEWFGAIAGMGDRAHDGGVMILTEVIARHDCGFGYRKKRRGVDKYLELHNKVGMLLDRVLTRLSDWSDRLFYCLQLLF